MSDSLSLFIDNIDILLISIVHKKLTSHDKVQICSVYPVLDILIIVLHQTDFYVKVQEMM